MSDLLPIVGMLNLKRIVSIIKTVAQNEILTFGLKENKTETFNLIWKQFTCDLYLPYTRNQLKIVNPVRAEFDNYRKFSHLPN